MKISSKTWGRATERSQETKEESHYWSDVCGLELIRSWSCECSHSCNQMLRNAQCSRLLRGLEAIAAAKGGQTFQCCVRVTAIWEWSTTQIISDKWWSHGGPFPLMDRAGGDKLCSNRWQAFLAFLVNSNWMEFKYHRLHSLHGEHRHHHQVADRRHIHDSQDQNYNPCQTWVCLRLYLITGTKIRNRSWYFKEAIRFHTLFSIIFLQYTITAY